MRAPLSWIKEFVDIPASVTAENKKKIKME